MHWAASNSLKPRANDGFVCARKRFGHRANSVPSVCGHAPGARHAPYARRARLGRPAAPPAAAGGAASASSSSTSTCGPARRRVPCYHVTMLPCYHVTVTLREPT
eukprot:3475795-Prymnesium_polylepis.1